MKFFTVKYQGNDYSKRLKDFGSAEVPFSLLAAEAMHVGFEKPFNSFYLEFGTKNTEAVNLTFEYYDSELASYQPLDVVDESEAFIQSGFVLFEKPANWGKSTFDGDEKFYIRITTDADLTNGTTLKGLAMLLSNDLDLERVRSNIVSKFNNGESWILKHEAAKKYIIQELRNRGNRKVINTDNTNPVLPEGMRFADITEFDLLDPFQLRQASIYLTLSMIYLDELTDEEEDKFFRQGLRYENEYNKAFDLFFLKLDTDNDGLEDDFENAEDTGINLSWH